MTTDQKNRPKLQLAEAASGLTGFLKTLFEPTPQQTPEQLEQQLHTAVTALLIETARADFTQDANEEAALKRRIRKTLTLNEQAVEALFDTASDAADKATSLYEFTRLINDHYSPEQKKEVIEAMWQVAWADGEVSKYEEHLIRQVAELTYVSHQDFIRAKQHTTSPDISPVNGIFGKKD